jgi:hypothetical protein
MTTLRLAVTYEATITTAKSNTTTQSIGNSGIPPPAEVVVVTLVEL